MLSAVLVYVRVYQFVNFLKASECRSHPATRLYEFFGTKKEIKNLAIGYSRMKMEGALAQLFCMESYYESQQKRKLRKLVDKR